MGRHADVVIALDMAQKGLNIPFTVRSSGHCTAGFSAGFGVLIDVSALNDVAIDTAAQIATVATTRALPSNSPRTCRPRPAP